MRLILYIVGGLVAANIITATFIWPPEETSPPPRVVVNQATQKGQDPWMVKETYNAPYRDFVRGNLLKTLDAPWSEYCSEDGHKRLVSGINGYYEVRDKEVRNYADVYGETARKFALKTWTTPDDNRIERLIGERVARGYVSAGELQPLAKRELADQIKGSRAGAKPCAS